MIAHPQQTRAVTVDGILLSKNEKRRYQAMNVRPISFSKRQLEFGLFQHSEKSLLARDLKKSTAGKLMCQE